MERLNRLAKVVLAQGFEGFWSEVVHCVGLGRGLVSVLRKVQTI